MSESTAGQPAGYEQSTTDTAGTGDAAAAAQGESAAADEGAQDTVAAPVNEADEDY
jgi:hypothetical protein